MEKYQGLDGTYIVDVEHWPHGPCGTAGPHFPSQLTHGTVINCDGFHIALGTDHLSANGWHIHEEFTQDYSSAMTPILNSLSEAALKRLSGNGQHLASMLTWFLYVFANTCRRPTLKLVAEPSMLVKGSSMLLDGFGSLDAAVELGGDDSE